MLLSLFDPSAKLSGQGDFSLVLLIANSDSFFVLGAFNGFDTQFLAGFSLRLACGFRFRFVGCLLSSPLTITASQRGLHLAST